MPCSLDDERVCWARHATEWLPRGSVGAEVLLAPQHGRFRLRELLQEQVNRAQPNVSSLAIPV
jgi:hypothetical protein